MAQLFTTKRTSLLFATQHQVRLDDGENKILIPTYIIIHGESSNQGVPTTNRVEWAEEGRIWENRLTRRVSPESYLPEVPCHKYP